MLFGSLFRFREYHGNILMRLFRLQRYHIYRYHLILEDCIDYYCDGWWCWAAYDEYLINIRNFIYPSRLMGSQKCRFLCFLYPLDNIQSHYCNFYLFQCLIWAYSPDWLLQDCDPIWLININYVKYYDDAYFSYRQENQKL